MSVVGMGPVQELHEQWWQLEKFERHDLGDFPGSGLDFLVV